MSYSCIFVKASVGENISSGYLSIDGGKEVLLSHEMIIPIVPGMHNFQFSTKSAAERKVNNLNKAVGNDTIAAMGEHGEIDGHVSCEIPEDCVMYFTVITNGRGKIIDIPKYEVSPMNDDQRAYVDQYIDETRSVGVKKKARWQKILLGSISAIVLGVIFNLIQKAVGVDSAVYGAIKFISESLVEVGIVVGIISFIKWKKYRKDAKL